MRCQTSLFSERKHEKQSGQGSCHRGRLIACSVCRGTEGPAQVCGKPLTREEMEVQLQFNRHDGTPGLDQYHLHHRCQVGEWTPEQRQLVFPTATGVPVKYIHFLTEIWRPTLKKAGLAARKYHSTRHSYAAWSLSAGVDLRVVSEALGHASVKLTLDTYARHISVEQREQAGRLLDAWLDAK